VRVCVCVCMYMLCVCVSICLRVCVCVCVGGRVTCMPTSATILEIQVNYSRYNAFHSGGLGCHSFDPIAPIHILVLFLHLQSLHSIRVSDSGRCYIAFFFFCQATATTLSISPSLHGIHRPFVAAL
jgi:hypothetical protein